MFGQSPSLPRPTIKLIGDTTHNIAQIVASLPCSCGIHQELTSILQIYTDKIHRLRLQRDRLLHQVRILQEAHHPPNSTTSVTNKPDSNLPSCTPSSGSSQEEINIFQLLADLQISNSKREASDVFVDLSESQIQHQPLTEEESLLLSESSPEPKGRAQAQEEQQNIKTPKKLTPHHHEPSKNSKPLSFQEFLEERVSNKLSAHRFIEDIHDLRHQRINKVESQKSGKRIEGKTGKTVGQRENQTLRITSKNPMISQFRLPLRERPETRNLLQ